MDCIALTDTRHTTHTDYLMDLSLTFSPETAIMRKCRHLALFCIQRGRI